MADDHDIIDSKLMKRDEGLSILEVIISLGVFSLILVVISSLQLTIFTQNRLSEARASIDQRSLIVLRNFATEVRAAQTPYDGSFVLANTTADTEVSENDKRFLIDRRP